MIEVLGKAAVLVAIIALGFASKRIGWTQASDFGVLSRILLRITLPCAIATSFNEFHITPSLLYVTGLSMLILASQAAAGFFLGRPDGRQGEAFGILNLGTFNIGAFAMPYLGAFFGPSALVYAALFDIGNALLGAGVNYAWAIMLATGRPARPWPILKTLFSSVVFDVYLFLLVIGLLGLRLPPQVIAFTTVVGSANTFVAMFTIGVGLEIAVSRTKYLTAARHLLVRYLLSAAWIAVVWFTLPIDPAAKVVIILMLCAPLAAMASGFTGEAGLDVEASTLITSVSVLVAIVAMPLVATALM